MCDTKVQSTCLIASKQTCVLPLQNYTVSSVYQASENISTCTISLTGNK